MPANDLSTTSWIQKTANVCGGEACIRKTRIAVWMLVNARRLGISEEELLKHYDPPLTREDVTAAWDYYLKNREEIERAIRLNEDA